VSLVGSKGCRLGLAHRRRRSCVRPVAAERHLTSYAAHLESIASRWSGPPSLKAFPDAILGNNDW
jgi:hypothetical protein